MLDRMRSWLVPPDAIERHVLTARLLGHPPTVVDVGGISGHLAAHLPGTSVTAVNVDPNADIVIEAGPRPLPLPDRSFAAAVSLDTLEHIPGVDRPMFVGEVLRLASSRAIVCCPLGTPERRQIEEADNAFYRRLTGVDHPWIGEHLEHGVPTQAELVRLFADDDFEVTFRFSGDSRSTSRQFRLAETANVRRGPMDRARWAGFRLTHRPDFSLHNEPTPFSHRVFVIAERRARASSLDTGTRG